jgi:hypothetical protein
MFSSLNFQGGVRAAPSFIDIPATEVLIMSVPAIIYRRNPGLIYGETLKNPEKKVKRQMYAENDYRFTNKRGSLEKYAFFRGVGRCGLCCESAHV